MAFAYKPVAFLTGANGEPISLYSPYGPSQSQRLYTECRFWTEKNNIN